MSHFTRRIIFWSFFLLFIVLTFYFSLVASGYSINWSFLKDPCKIGFLQKTGILALNSNPSGAQIELDRNFKSLFAPKDILKDKKIKTPYKIKNLIPGEYSLKIELDGYWPFEKTVYIDPGQTTYLEDVVLLKKTLPVMLFSSPVQEVKINNFSSHLIFIDDNKFFDINNEVEVGLEKNVDSLDFLSDNFLLINDKEVFNYKEKKYLDFKVEDKSNIRNIKDDKNNLYYLDSDSLFSYNFIFQENNLILNDTGLVDYYFSGDYIFLISQHDNFEQFKIYSNKDKKIIRFIDLPLNGDYRFIPSENNLIFVYDQLYSSLYLIDPFSQLNPIRDVLRNIKDINFVDNNSFLYFSNFEIRIFNLSLMQSSLVSRFEKEIKSLLWHPRGYVIFSDGKNIKAIDFKYDKYITNLFTFDTVSGLKLDKNGGSLFFTGKIGNREGLYKLFIQ